MTIKTHIEIVARAAFAVEAMFLLMLPLASACVRHIDAFASAPATFAVASAGVPFVLFALFLTNPDQWPHPLRWLRQLPCTRYIAASCIFTAAVLSYLAGTFALTAGWGGVTAGLALAVVVTAIGVEYLWSEPTHQTGQEITAAARHS